MVTKEQMLKAFEGSGKSNTTQTRLSELEKSISNYGGSWQSQENTAALQKKIYSEKMRAAFNSDDELIKKLDEISKDINERSKFYSKYKSADEYGVAVKNAGYSQKYKGYSYQQIKDLLESDGYTTKRRRGLIDESEAEWLKNQRYALATSAEIQQEIEALGGEEKWLSQKSNAENQRVMSEGEKRRAIKSGAYNSTHENSSKLQKEAQANLDQIALLKTILAQKKKQEEFDKKWGSITVDDNYSPKINKEETNGYYRTVNSIPAKDFKDEFVDKYLIGPDLTVQLQRLKLMEKPERDKYNLIYEEQGIEKANEYADDLVSNVLDARLNQNEMEEFYKFSSENPFFGSVGSVFFSLGSGLEYAQNLLSGQTDKRILSATRTQGLREGAKSQIDSEFWDFIYDTGMSGVDSIAAAGISAMAPYLGEILLGGSAAASTFNDALDRGVTGGDVILSSIAAGTAESLFEHLSIGKLFDIKDLTGGFTKAGIKQAAKKIGTDILVNASEETLTEIANIVTDQLINTDLSSYAIAVKDYYMQGMPIEVARSKAASDLGSQVLTAMASGALMGFGFGAGGSIVGLSSSQIKNSKYGNVIISNQSLDSFKSLAADSGISDIVKDAEKLTEKSKPSQIGAVFNRLVQTKTNEAVKSMETALLENGATKSGSNSAKGWAIQIIKTALSPKNGKIAMQDVMLRTNKVTSEVYTDFADNGKYGGDTLLALNELVTSPKTQTATEGNSVGATGEGATDNGSFFDEPNISEDNTNPQTLAERYYEVPKALTKDQAYVKEVGAKLGRKVVFEHTEQKKGFKSDGYIDKNGIIHIDYAIKNPLQFIFKHELTHFLEKSKFTYSDFANAVMDSEAFSEWVKSKGYESVDAYRRSIIDLYLKIDPQFNEPKANKEMLANFVGEKLFGNDLASLEKLLQAMEPKQRRTFIEFIRDFIKYLKEKFIKDTSLTAQIERLEKQFIEAYQAAETEFEQQKTAENNGGEEFSIQKASDGSLVVIVDTDQGIFVGVEPSEYSKIARQYFNEHFKNVTLPLGENDAVSMSKKMPGEYAYPHTTLDKNSPEYASKMKAITELDNLLKTAHNHSFSEDTKGNPEATLGWDYYEVEFLCDGKQVSGLINIANSEKGRVFYDMTKIKVAPAISEKYIALLAQSQSTSQVATNNNVPQKSNVVNNNISQNTSNDTDSAEFLYVGEKSKTADKLKLSTAKQMLKDGADSETIRKETGWFKGYDGKWRFEINDKDVGIDEGSDFVRYLNLISKKEKTKEEAKEFFTLTMKYFDDYVNGEIALDKFVKHDLLFEAYPELRDINLKFIFEEAVYKGMYIPTTKTIVLPKEVLKDESELKIILVHELQHAVQDIEGFARGASGVYWQMRKDSGEVFLDENGNEISNWDLYERTAGEIEARDAMNRVKLTDKQRKNKRPDIDRKDVVFADKELVSTSENAQYSIPSDHNYVYTDGKASFTEERLNNLFDEHSLGDGKRAEHSNAYVGYISPEDFVNLTSNKNIRSRVEDEAYVLNEEELRNETETPFIEYDPASGEVVGHEGRHRMVALKADGITKVAVLLKPSTDSFERRTVQDISLTGQNFAGGKASGNVTVKNAIPLSEKYREKAIQKFAKNPDADVRYSLPDVDEADSQIEEQQTEIERIEKRINQIQQSAEYQKASADIDDFNEFLRETDLGKEYNRLALKRGELLGRLDKLKNTRLSSKGKKLSYGQRKYFARSRVRDSKGRLLIMYHGTSNYGFTIFNELKTRFGLFGNGFYFTDNEDVANSYQQKGKGGKFGTYAVFLNITNPLDMDKKANIAEWEKAAPDAKEYFAGCITNEDCFRALKEYCIDEEMIQYEAEEFIFDVISYNMGYDGITHIGGGRFNKQDNTRHRVYIAFNSEQIKSVDNLNPTEDVDYRYSLPMEDANTLLDMYENKQITREEYLNRLNQSRNRKAETPLDIARMTKEDANTTPPLKRKQGEAKGDSESKLYTSLQKSDIFNDEFKAEFKNDSFIKKYQSVGNAETMREAAKELDAGGQAYVNKWHDKDAKHASLIDIAVGFILLDRYQRIGDKDSAAGVGEKLREMATASGQQVQIFSILGRFDADSMALYAQMELSKAFEVFKKEKTRRWLDANADRFNLTDEDIEFIRRRTLQAAEMPENSREKAVLLGEIAARVQDKLPPNKGQAYKAFQRIAMLLNPKTLERNIIGNATITPVFIASDYFGTVVDKIVSLKTGVRTTGAFKANSVKSFGKGIYESYDDFKRHIHTKQEQLNRFDVGAGKSFNENHKGLLRPINAISRILNSADRLTSFCLEVGDRPFYEMWFINSLNNQMRLNNVTEATPEMVEIATEEALERTWQNDNYMTKAATGARTFLNYLSYPVYKVFGVGLGDVFIKFTKTPANLVKALIDFSPVSIAKVGYDAVQLTKAIQKGEFDATLQKKLVNDISKSIMGILVMILTAALFEMGALTGGGDDDKDLAYFEKNLAGKAPYSVIIGDTSVSYEWLQPISGLVAMVNDYMKAEKENPDNEWYNNLKEAFKAGGTVLFNQSFMKNIQQLFSSDDIFGNLWDGILSEPSVFVPQILSQTASAMDEYSRDTYENDNLQTALNKVKVKIPGLRETLPKSVDTLGNEVDNQRYGILNSFFNPANVYPENSGAVADEVYGLYKSTGDATVIPRKAPYNLTVKGIKHTFTTEDRAAFQKVVGKTSNDIVDSLLNERDYENLTELQKVELITTVYNYATAKAKSDVVYSYEIISAMYGGSISQELYNRLTEAEKKKLAEFYFMDDYYDSKYKPKFEQGEEAEYFLEKILDKYGKEEKQSKKDKYKQKELNKILN